MSEQENKNRKKAFVLYYDSLEIFDKLNDEQTGKIFKAMIEFQLHGVLPELDFALDLVFTPFKNQFVRDNEKWEQASLKKSKGRKKGWKQTKKSEYDPNNPDDPKAPF